MERVEFRLSSFVEFMYALKEENEYIIYLTINESKDKGK